MIDSPNYLYYLITLGIYIVVLFAIIFSYYLQKCIGIKKLYLGGNIILAATLMSAGIFG